MLPWATVMSPARCFHSADVTGWATGMEGDVLSPGKHHRSQTAEEEPTDLAATLKSPSSSPRNLFTLLSPLDACDRQSLKPDFPSPSVGSKVRMSSFALSSNKAHARAPMISFSPSGTVWVPAILPFAQTSEEGAVALMRKLGSQFGRECSFSVDLYRLQGLILARLLVCARH